MATKHSKLMIGGGIALAAGPMLGVGMTTIMMFFQFSRLGKNGPVEPQSAQTLAEWIGESLLFSAAGGAIGLIGLVVFLTGFFTWLNSPERLSARSSRR